MYTLAFDDGLTFGTASATGGQPARSVNQTQRPLCEFRITWYDLARV